MPRFLLPIILLAFSFPASAQQDADAKAVLTAESEWVAAHDAMDSAAIDAVLADGFAISYPNGHSATKAEILAGLASDDFGPIVIAAQRREGHTVEVSGDEATVTGVQVVDWRGEEVRSSYTDTYRRVGGQWKLASSQLAAEPGR